MQLEWKWGCHEGNPKRVFNSLVSLTRGVDRTPQKIGMATQFCSLVHPKSSFGEQHKDIFVLKTSLHYLVIDTLSNFDKSS